MNPPKAKPNTIAEYILNAPELSQEKLRELYACLQEVAPGAKQSLKWGQPALSYEWILFIFAGFKHHISLYPTPSVVSAFKKELAPFVTSTTTIQFPNDTPLPLPLIRKIAAYRVEESKKGVKWL